MEESLHSRSATTSVLHRLCVFIFSFCTTFLTGSANAEPAPASKWQPYLDLQTKLGTERSLGRASLFLPLAQGNTRLLFADARFTFDDSSASEGNLGLAYRYRFGEPMNGGILGIYGFFDYRNSENNFTYKQLTGGLEWLANDWEVRGNVYVPEDNKNPVSSSVTNDVALNGTTAVYRSVALSYLEQALPGYDVEAGYRFALNDRSNIWVHGGYFDFHDTGAPTVKGPRLRLEYRLQDPFGWRGSVLGLGLEAQDDNVRGSQSFATARLRIPIGKVNKASALVGLDRRMVNPIQRDVDVVTAVNDAPVEEVVGETPITDPDSGEVINVYFVEENGSGDCSQANPCVVGSAQGDAVYGVADIIVPLSDSGDITSDIVLTQPRQQVVGGGNAGNAILSLSSGDILPISALGGRATLAGTLSMTRSSFAAGFNINHSNPVAAISANGISNVGVRDVEILGSGGAGFDFNNVSGSITIENSSAINAVGAGLRINGGSASYVLNNLDISDTASGRSVDIQGTTGGLVSFDIASSINNSAGSGLLIDNIGGNVTFNGGVNVTGATSNAVTATNLNGNSVAFTGSLNIDTASGTGLSASNGSLNIADTVTTISAVNGSALDLNNVSVGNGSGGALSFANLSSNGGANGINLSGVNASNGLTISNVTLANNTSVGLNINAVSGNLNINAANIDAAVAGTGVTIAGSNGTMNIGTGGAGLDIDGGSIGVSINQSAGIVNLGSGASGTFAIDGTSGAGVALAGAGTVNIGTGGGSATMGSTAVTGGTAFQVNGGSVNANYNGNITQSNNISLVSVNGGHNGTLNFGSGTLSATNGSGLQFNNADGSYIFNGTTILNGGDAGIDIVNGSGGNFNFGTGTSITNPSGTAFNVDGGNGTVNYNGTITNTSGRAAIVQNRNGGNVTLAGNIIDSGTGGLLLQNNTAGSANFTGTISSTVVDLSNNTSAINFGGALSLSDGIVLSNNNTSTIGFNSLSIDGAAIGVLSDNSGVVTVSGTTSISNAGTAAIRVTAGGTGSLSFADVLIDNAAQTGIDIRGAGGVLNFGNVDITNFGGSNGVWAENASAGVTLASLDISGTGAAGSRGVDITGATGSLVVTNAGTLQDLEVGVELDRLGTGSTNATLSFQGGSINAGVPVNTVGITAGSYDFTGTSMIKNNALSTATGFGGDFWFADATGGGTGTSTDRASLDFVESNSASNDILLLVNDGTGSIVASNGLQLKDNQQLLGFASGDATVDFTGSNANVIGNFAYLISDPTGNGAATLSNSGGTEVITLANNTKLRDFNLVTTGAVDGISGNGFSGTTINSIAISNAGADAFDFTNAAGTISITDSSATNSTGAGLRLSGGNATVALNNFDISDTATGRSLDISSTTGGSISFDTNSSISNSGGTGVLINNIGGDVTFNGAVSVTGATTNAIEASTLNGNTVAFNAGLGTVSTTAGTALLANGGILNIAGTTTLSATNAQALSFSNLTVGNGSGGALSFDSITSTGGANGIALSNVTAANGLTITDATLANNTTAGININGVSGSAAITAANIDGAAAATNVAIAGANGTINIGTGGTGLDIDGGTTGVSINQTSGTVNLGTGASGGFAVDGTSGAGVTLAGAGTVNIGTGGGSSTIGATTDTGGTAFAVTGGTVNANYAGSIDLASNAGLVSVQGGHSGTLTFSGALSNSAATNATQLRFDNADGAYNFDGTVNVDTSAGTGVGLDVTATSSGTIDFDNSLTIATASGNAIQMAGTGNLDISGGGLDVDTTSGTGLSQSAGTVTLSDTTSIRASTTGTGINASGGNISVANGAGTAEVISTSGQGLLLSGVTLGTGGVTFDTVNAGGGANGITLTNVNATNGLTISNATLANNTTAGININGVSGSATITAANIDGAAAATGVAIAGANDTINIGTGGTGLDIDGGTTGVSINQTSGTVNLGTGASGGFAVDGTSGAGVTLAGAGTVNIGTAGGSSTIGATTDTAGTAFAVTGGTVNANYAGSIDLASNADLVSVQGGHSGTLTFSGALSNSAATNATQFNFNNANGSYNFDGVVNVDTSAGTGIGIDVAATSSGTINFDNSLTIATASGNAIQMAGAGGLDISGGNLDIVTTSGAGFSATGGGTVNVSGANNSIVTTTGTALNIANTTIGVSGLTFRSVSVNGAANGIVLNNTGTSGGLSITGDGATGGSGGTIQNTTGVGISLTNSSDVSLSYLNISNTAAAGISGSGVSGGFSLQGSTIQNTVGHNVGLSAVTGAINISNNTLLDANEDGGSDLLDENNGIDIANTAGTITSLTVTNNSIQGTSGTTSDVGVALHLDGTAVLTSAIISQNTIQGHDFNAVRLSLDNDDSGDAPVVSALDISNNAVLSSEATAVELNARGASDLSFTVSNNTQISSDFGNGIQLNAGLFAVGGNSTATVSGNISNNSISNVGDAANDRGIDILSQESSAVVVNIDANTISNVSNGGIALRVRDTSSLDTVVNNNTLSNTDTFGGSVLGVFAETRETSTGCFAITNNSNALTYQLNQSAGTVFNLEPMVGNTGTVNTSGTITAVSSNTCTRVP